MHGQLYEAGFYKDNVRDGPESQEMSHIPRAGDEWLEKLSVITS